MKKLATRSAVVFLACAAAGCRNTPDFGEPLPPERCRSDLPVFVMDAEDAARHPILAVFVGPVEDEHGRDTEITVVFHDETPSYWGAPTLFLSEPFRRLRFGRWEDVESLRYDHGESGNEEVVEAIYFDGTFAKSQSYSEPIPRHYDRTEPLQAFLEDGGASRPVIYVTTWNHLFHWLPKDLEGRKLERIERYPVYPGNRDVVNALFAGDEVDAEP